jgi:creatinine amidohydrolase/Fe(II)-dependent formamide hydrolase-like protein
VNHRSKEYWVRHVVALANSGLSRAAYCRHHGLSYSALTSWQRRLREEKERRQVSPALLPVMVAGPVRSADTSIEIRIGTDVVVSFPSTVEAQWFGTLLRTMAAC